MERTPWHRLKFITVAMLVAAVTLPATGCVFQLISALMYDGRKEPALYDGLQERRVAVVCVSRSGVESPQSHCATIGRKVGQILQENVKKIDVVSHREIEDWIDQNGRIQVEGGYAALGEGVGADSVVVLELEKFSLRDDPTIYKGRSLATILVYDLRDGGRETVVDEQRETEFPKYGGQSTASGSDSVFRRKFIDVLAGDLAKAFYAYDIADDIALDATAFSP